MSAFMHHGIGDSKKLSKIGKIKDNQTAKDNKEFGLVTVKAFHFTKGRKSILFAKKMLPLNYLCPMKNRANDIVWLRDFLNEKVLVYNRASFIENDPISIVHRFSSPRDIELIGLLMATIAWGNRKSIIRSGEKIIQLMDHSPYEFITGFQLKDEKRILQSKFVHRTFQSTDLLFFCRSLRRIIKEWGSLESVFAEGFNGIGANAGVAIEHFRKAMLEVPHQPRQTKHISNPAANSACKRLNMFLRWMVRKDHHGVDFGIWQSVSPSKLSIPLDIHTGNTSRELGMLKGTVNDWKAVVELDEVLRILDKQDPVKYDFALFGLGAYGWEPIH
jgi:uncharacterized protein (TIGR02757 family)